MAADKKKQAKAPATTTTKPKTAPAEDSEHQTYRVLADCRVGHLRREGEVFNWPTFPECPDYLEEVDGDDEQEGGHREDAAAGEKESAAAQGATLADLGLGPAQSAAEVTSGDMINQ